MKSKFMLLFAVIPLFFSCKEKKEASLSFMAMDTFMTLKCQGEYPEEVNLQVKETIESLDQSLSVTLPGSDFYRLNSAENFPVEVGEDAVSLLNLSVKYSELSRGAFDITLYPVMKEWGFTNGNYHVPAAETIESLLKKVDYKKIKTHGNSVTLEKGQMVDPGAIGKGLAGDKAIEIYKSKGVKSAMVDLGGNIQLLGKNPRGRDWLIGLRNPWGGEPVLGLKVHDCAVITSGGYERHFIADDGKKYIHIFDPETGCPVDNSLVSVTVVADTGAFADALSTALFVMGQEKAQSFWKEHGDFQMLIITEDRKLIYTAGLKDKIIIHEDFSSVQVLD
ncbi:FAD:protein FMN transferase [Treponema sp.]|uniref:FAD:protein FMN transferase n=1 Tax=Treponema sp. TaxID=166 RepID=UPI0025EBD0AE|nr:FAD:protein FMN transferase [Treponema sp.]MCR5218575.1 FAD:protein FMN transferase [Treponema sp.]